MVGTMATVTSPSYNHVRNPRGSSGILDSPPLPCHPLKHSLFASPRRAPLSPSPLPFLPSRFFPVCTCWYHCHRVRSAVPLSSSEVIRYDPAGLTSPKLEGIIWGREPVSRTSRIATARETSRKSWRTAHRGIIVNTPITAARSLLLVAFESREERGRMCN